MIARSEDIDVADPETWGQCGFGAGECPLPATVLTPSMDAVYAWCQEHAELVESCVDTLLGVSRGD